MNRFSYPLLALCGALLLSLGTAAAQDQTSSLSLDIRVERDAVRFTVGSAAQQLRVEIFNPAGQQVFDSGIVTASTVEWNLRDEHGERVVDGVYLAGIRVKQTDGTTLKRIEQIAINSKGPQGATEETAQSATMTVMGGGTAGQLAKWTSASTLGNSLIAESNGKIGLGTTAPTADLHIFGVQPAASATTGTAAPTLLQTSGGKGGNTTAAGHTAGAGASISILAGTGGDAVAGSTRGSGGSITLQPGGPGGGAGSGGVTGNLLLAPTGGNVGVGTTTPANKLTVAGVIQSTSGGVKFPDNTVQTTASKGGTITGVSAGTGLTGGGTTGAVSLGILAGGIGNTQLAANAVTAPKIASGQVVKSLNSLTDNVTLAAGSSNITITPSGNILKIDAPNAAFTGVTHDSTLSGSGTSGSPLGVASGTYIQNGTAAQTANFNITGNGIVGGNLTASGNVGIGTSTAQTKLTVQTGTGFYGLTHTDGTITVGSYIGGSQSGAFGGWLGTKSNHQLHFFTNNGQPSMTVDITGNVGIGTTAPSYRLDVVGPFRAIGNGLSNDINVETTGGTNAWAQLRLKTTDQRWLLGTSQNFNGDQFYLVDDTNNQPRMTIQPAGGAISFPTGNVGIGTTTPTSTLHVAGTAQVNVLQINGGADLAERFDLIQGAQPGLLVAIDPQHAGQLAIARGPYNRRVAGVISGANHLSAGMVLSNLSGARKSMPIALSGRVWVYCDATLYPIRPGDLLTTSRTPGHAMKVTNYARAKGAIIGKAMSGLQTGRGLVLVLVTLQ